MSERAEAATALNGGRGFVVTVVVFFSPRSSYGTQQPIALLKLLLEMGGMFGRDKDLNWRRYKDITYFAAMSTAMGAVDARFVSKFAVFNVVFPGDPTLRHIYTSILAGHLAAFGPDVQPIAGDLIDITLRLFKRAVVELPPTPAKFHYIFNMKDLSRICAGLLLADPAVFVEQRQLVRVWRNEFTRVICDRLNGDADIGLMRAHMQAAIRETFAAAGEAEAVAKAERLDEMGGEWGAWYCGCCAFHLDRVGLLD